MELRHLRYFATLAEELNFGRAAMRLHISQPPLTRQIQQMEEELGAQLFTRSTRGVALTPAGKVLLEDARRILGLVQGAKERAGKAGRGQIGRLDVGIFGSAILNHIPRMVLQFRDQHPEVQIALHGQTKAEQIQALREKRLTIGFNRRVSVESDIAVEPVLSEPLFVALHDKHPLARLKAIRIEDIGNAPMILYPSNTRPGFADDVMDLFRKAAIQPTVVQEVTDVVTAVALVACGFGLCITPQAASSLNLPGVVFRPVKANPTPTIDLVCLYRRNDESPILAAFLEIVRSFRAANET
jgi:DNA-binding transcriptional LysR family regulator